MQTRVRLAIAGHEIGYERVYADKVAAIDDLELVILDRDIRRSRFILKHLVDPIKCKARNRIAHSSDWCNVASAAHRPAL